MAKSVKEHFNLGAARELMNELIAESADLRAKYDAHKHSFDGTGGASQVSGTPVTGATSGTAAGGVASPAAAATVTV